MNHAKSLLAFASVLLLGQTAHAKVVINELLHATGGSTDFVELYNQGPEAVDISGWTLESATKSTSYSTKATVPAGTTLAADGYWLITRAPLDADAGDAGVARQMLGAALPAAGSSTDGVRLKDDAGAVVDTVLFGSPNDEAAPFVDDANVSPATSLAPKWSGTRSLGRAPNGVDTDACGTDFVLAPDGHATPGAHNYEAPPPPDAGSTSSSSSSSSGAHASSSSSGGKSSSSTGGMHSEADDDDDNSGIGTSDGGCSASPGTPISMLLGLGALFLFRRRRSR